MKRVREMVDSPWQSCPYYFLRQFDEVSPFDLRRCNLVCRSWRGGFEKKYSKEMLTWITSYMLFNPSFTPKIIVPKHIPTLPQNINSGSGFPAELSLDPPFKLRRMENFILDNFDPKEPPEVLPLFPYPYDRMTNESKIDRFMDEMKNIKKPKNSLKKLRNFNPNIDPFLFFEYVVNIPRSGANFGGKSIALETFLQRCEFCDTVGKRNPYYNYGHAT